MQLYIILFSWQSYPKSLSFWVFIFNSIICIVNTFQFCSQSYLVKSTESKKKWSLPQRASISSIKPDIVDKTFLQNQVVLVLFTTFWLAFALNRRGFLFLKGKTDNIVSSIWKFHWFFPTEFIIQQVYNSLYFSA